MRDLYIILYWVLCLCVGLLVVPRVINAIGGWIDKTVKDAFDEMRK